MAHETFPCSLKQRGQPGCDKLFSSSRDESNHRYSCAIAGLWVKKAMQDAQERAKKEMEAKEKVNVEQKDNIVCSWSIVLE